MSNVQVGKFENLKSNPQIERFEILTSTFQVGKLGKNISKPSLAKCAILIANRWVYKIFEDFKPLRRKI